MSRQIISTPEAPKAIGPYSQAVAARAGRLLFCSGQIPLDPRTGEMVGAGGASFAAVVKTTIYLADLQDFGAVNEVYGRFFPNEPPARATVQAAGLPKGALLEIDAIAALQD